MIGFRSVLHQGYVAARESDAVNHYPVTSQAWFQFEDGMKAYHAGRTLNRRGEILREE